MSMLDPTDNKNTSNILETIDDAHSVSSEHLHSEALPDTNDAIDHWTPEQRTYEEKELVRKLDLRFLPAIIVIFIMNYIDKRTAVTAARLKGLEQDLHLSDVQYQSILAVLYASYSVMQLPSNMILNKISRPSLYIGTCVVLWGLVSAATGATRNFAGIAACRFFLGIPEAAFYPGAMYMLSRWYTRKELAFRSALLYSGLLISNAFGSLMAAGILSGMQGRRGIAAWRWLFYIEGAITVTLGFLSMWIMPDYPHNTRWIHGAQRRLAQARLSTDAAEADQDGTGDSAFVGLKMTLKDPKVLIFALLHSLQSLGLSFVNFFPTLTATLGYSTTASLLLAAPPWIFAAIVCLVNAWHADRTGERFLHIAGWWWIVVVGYIIALSTMNTAGRYVSMCLMACGYAGFALTLVWVSNAVPRPPAKRAAAIGLIGGVGNVGTMAGSFAWKAKWGPRYYQSMILGIVSLALSTCLAFAIRLILIHANRQMDLQDLDGPDGRDEGDAARVREASRLEGIEIEEAVRRRKGFRYLY